jgi:Antitoxin SocA-like, Panacea domain
VRSQPRPPVTFEYRFDKVLAVLVYLASQRDKVTVFDKKKALSLLFLADKAYLLRYGSSISGDYYRALEYGSVPQRTLDRLNKFAAGAHGADIERLAKLLRLEKVAGHDFPVLVAKARPDLSALSELELRTINDIVTKYGDKDFNALADPIHPRAWHKAWNAKPPHRKAAPMSYEDLFEDPEATEGAREQMIENFEIRRALSGR